MNSRIGYFLNSLLFSLFFLYGILGSSRLFYLPAGCMTSPLLLHCADNAAKFFRALQQVPLPTSPTPHESRVFLWRWNLEKPHPTSTPRPRLVQSDASQRDGEAAFHSEARLVW